jgi:hypothetical protein
MDNDLIVLEDAAASVISIDKKYRKADFNDKLLLKKDRDKAFNTYAKARLKLLEDGVICKQKDIDEMKEIRSQIAHARKTQSILIAIGRLIVFLAKKAV